MGRDLPRKKASTEIDEETTMLWLIGTYLLTSALSLSAFVFLIVALPPTYFCADRHVWIDRHPLLRWVGVLTKNLLGLAIIVLGILLSLPGIPGQGLLTIAIGVMLLDFPGKHRWIVAILGRPAVLARINELRRIFGRPPLVVPTRDPR